MDFITRKDSDIKRTEVLYGKNSDQYKLKNLLIEAENKLRETRKLILEKECKQEFISISCYAERSIVKHIIKTYYTKDKAEVKREKKKELAKPISSFINDDIYDLIVNGKYKIK